MTDEEKYYTPELTEFHLGFEFEYFYDNKWCTHIFGKLKFIHKELDQYEDELMKVCHAICRVKYLDREDVESCMWMLDEAASDAQFTKYYDEDKGRELVYCQSIGKYKILSFEYLEKDTLFFGVIKNKSELKKIMQQIGIK